MPEPIAIRVGPLEWSKGNQPAEALPSNIYSGDHVNPNLSVQRESGDREPTEAIYERTIDSRGAH